MDVKTLKEKLAQFDADIATKRGEVEDAQLDLKHLAERRKAFAMRNCEHPKEERYERSCMGREIDIYCGVCNTAL
jgi:hypothetical protein